LRLLHPYMPFMTEEAWKYIPHEGDALIIASWPQADPETIDDVIEAEMTLFTELVRDVRNVRKSYGVDPAKRIKAIASSETRQDLIKKYGYIFSRLCNVADVALLEDSTDIPANAASIVAGDITLYLPLEGMLDIQAECQRLNKEKVTISDQVEKLVAKLDNEGFVAKAPAQVVAKERERLAELQASLSQIQERLGSLC